MVKTKNGSVLHQLRIKKRLLNQSNRANRNVFGHIAGSLFSTDVEKLVVKGKVEEKLLKTVCKNE